MINGSEYLLCDVCGRYSYKGSLPMLAGVKIVAEDKLNNSSNLYQIINTL